MPGYERVDAMQVVEVAVYLFVAVAAAAAAAVVVAMAAVVVADAGAVVVDSQDLVSPLVTLTEIDCHRGFRRM